MNEHMCLVCGYDRDVEFFPRRYMICGCCGTEFGVDDRARSHADLRRNWIAAGCNWFDPEEPKPTAWNPLVQLLRAGFTGDALALVPVSHSTAAPRRQTSVNSLTVSPRFIAVERTHA